MNTFKFVTLVSVTQFYIHQFLGKMMNKIKDFDLYRQIPRDLTEATKHGSVMSLCACTFMLVLFIAELWAFLTMTLTSNVIIDPVADSRLRINFNITTLDLPCEYAVIDVVDVLGTRNSNVTKSISKWQIDSAGKRRMYEGRNTQQRDLVHDTHHGSIEELHENGVHATPMDGANFDSWVADHKYTFVNFYAPWCIWCQRLEPVWEAFAESVERDQFPVSVISVDCVANRDLCMSQKIQAFPSLRMFVEGQPKSPDYRDDRTVEKFNEYIRTKVSHDEQLKKMDPQTREQHLEAIEATRDDHPGCLISGFLLVNRVPGNFHIEARSKNHNLNPAMANTSHLVHHLSFGDSLSRNAQRRVEEIPNQFFNSINTHPIDDYEFTTNKFHQSFHHYIKVVSTQLELGSRYMGENAILAYQMVQSSQIMHYEEDQVPEARFAYDISPMAVRITREGKAWYEFITSICAIIGGTFTVISLLNSVLSVLFKEKRV